jgi:hypothetical protein
VICAITPKSSELWFFRLSGFSVCRLAVISIRFS